MLKKFLELKPMMQYFIVAPIITIWFIIVVFGFKTIGTIRDYGLIEKASFEEFVIGLIWVMVSIVSPIAITAIKINEKT